MCENDVSERITIGWLDDWWNQGDPESCARLGPGVLWSPR
jgi:hypothetical protein